MRLHDAADPEHGDAEGLLGADPAASAEVHARWLADWLRAWPGGAAADRARHFRALANEVLGRAGEMPGLEARRTLEQIADRYCRMAERYESQMRGRGSDS